MIRIRLCKQKHIAMYLSPQVLYHLQFLVPHRNCVTGETYDLHALSLQCPVWAFSRRKIMMASRSIGGFLAAAQISYTVSGPKYSWINITLGQIVQGFAQFSLVGFHIDVRYKFRAINSAVYVSRHWSIAQNFVSLIIRTTYSVFRTYISYFVSILL